MKGSQIAITSAVIGIGVSLSAIVMILAFGGNGSMMGNGGMMGGGYGMSSASWAGIALAAIVLITSIIVLIVYLLGEGLPAPIATQQLQPIQSYTAQPTPAVVAKNDTPEPAADEHLISRLLDGDERNLYQMIASAGGEVLQKDLVAKNVFSKAKVTRLLDKLEERGLIVRERHGMTNKIKIAK